MLSTRGGVYCFHHNFYYNAEQQLLETWDSFPCFRSREAEGISNVVKVLAIHSTCVYCEVPAVVKCIGLQNGVVLNVQVVIGSEDFLVHFVNSTCCVILQAGCYCRDKPPPHYGCSAQWFLTVPEMT
jgi:hypothetical protein